MASTADNYSNNADLEQAWAYRAMDEAETHYNLITSVDPDYLKLSEHDDEIYKVFRESFPDIDVNVLDENSLKSTESKKKWRDFCNKFEDVTNFNYGSMLRIDPMHDYTETNCIFATRIQYQAIEIARNREGITKRLYDKVTAERRARRAQGNAEINNLTTATAQVSVSS